MEQIENKFEIISDKNYKKAYKQSSGFGKTILLPFFSGIAGCALVIGTCFGVPSIKEKIIGESTVNQTIQTSTPSGTTTNLISLSNYSNTAVFAANKILPSIVGIQVTYTATTNSFFGFGMPTTSEATATGSGIIISEDGYIVTAKTSPLLSAPAALILNALKYLANINDELLLISPSIIEPVAKMKIENLGNKNPRLHADEVLIALAIQAHTNQRIS